MTNHDMELVRDYATHQSEQAFETLVSRHVNLVHAAALRQVRDPHLAQEITQAVFIILARKSGSLNAKMILPGWLYRTACYVAKDALRAQRRRQHYEQEASMQSTLHEAPADVAWQELSPLLDEAMMQLAQSDRDALVLRFFQNKNSQEIGAAIGMSEDAAKKRVSRAMEKLRNYFFKRGVTSSAATIAGAISANSLPAAPVGLAKSISAVAVTKGVAATASTLTLVNGALKIMAWSTAKTAAVSGAAVILVAATATVILKTSNDAGLPRSSGPAQIYKASLNGTDSIPQIPMGDIIDVNNREHLRTDAKARHLSTTVWPAEIQAMQQKIKAGQQMNLTADAVPINLAPYYNAKLSDGLVRGKINSLAALPSGVNLYGGVPFDVEGAIYLMGGGIARFDKVVPKEVDGIHVGYRCRKIYLFHGEQYIFFGNWGNTVSKLILHYEDGSTNELDLVAGKNAFDFWSPLFSTGVSPANLNGDPNTVPAWTGSNQLIHNWQPDESLVLLRTTFDNPQPNLTLESVDYVSNDMMTVPMLLGLTVE
jgi:RNA polymerase sigma factor (sigma-70 family)